MRWPKVRVFGVFYQNSVLSVLVDDGPDVLHRANTTFERRFSLSLDAAHAVFAVASGKDLPVQVWDFDQVEEELGRRTVV
jgi:hypothetical protein